MTKKLSNKKPQESDCSSHRVSWMSGHKWKEKSLVCKVNNFLTGEYKEFDSSPLCLYQLAKVNPTRAFIHFKVVGAHNYCLAGSLQHWQKSRVQKMDNLQDIVWSITEFCPKGYSRALHDPKSKLFISGRHFARDNNEDRNYTGYV